MRRLLAAATLVAAPLVALATPAAAAPPVHDVSSGCEDYGDYIYCYNFDTRVQSTLTPSGNWIYHSKGTNSYNVTYDSGVRYGDTWTFDQKFMYRQSQPHVDRTEASHTYYYEDSSCTDFTLYRFTNGKVQVADYSTACNF